LEQTADIGISPGKPTCWPSAPDASARPPDHPADDSPPPASTESPTTSGLLFEEIERYANETIRHRVNHLLGRFGFTGQDRQDLEADLRAHLISRLPCYRPDRGARTSFVAAVLLNRARRLVEARKASRRWLPIALSLDEAVEDEEGLALDRAEAFDHDDYLLRSNRISRPAHESCELALDVERAVEQLPPDLAELCRRLAIQTVREVSEETGVPKSTLHYRISRIRRIFEQEGLRGYVGSCPPDRSRPFGVLAGRNQVSGPEIDGSSALLSMTGADQREHA